MSHANKIVRLINCFFSLWHETGVCITWKPREVWNENTKEAWLMVNWNLP